jgi:Undecaprenyl-phosphate galactose phosphotransferase WbaP
MSTVIAAVQRRPVALRPTDVRSATRPMLSAIIIIVSDMAAVSIAFIGTIWMRGLLPARNYDPVVYLHLWPATTLFLIAYLLVGLYPGVAMNPVRELQRLSSATTLVFLLLVTAMFVAKQDLLYSRAVFFMAWAITLVLVPVARSLVRKSVSRHAWWGYSVVILGTGPASLDIAKKLLRHPERGLRPLAFANGSERACAIGCISVIEDLDAAVELSAQGVTHAIVAAAEFSSPQFSSVVHRYGSCFPHLLIAPEVPLLGTLCLESQDICHMLMLEVQNGLLRSVPQTVKRLMDLILATFLIVTLAPLLFIIAVLIKLDSAGPAVYSQWRIGRGGRPFRMRKFRTMVRDADAVLGEYLDEHPLEAAEWESNQKLKNDPRVSRVGALLRKTSFDELPQLWNVIVGQMSLVGPRPIVDAEVPKYRDSFGLYTRVVPGLTGIWQVSGRSNTTYEERVALDAYYVRNWSPWLDIYLIARTVAVILKHEGAY